MHICTIENNGGCSRKKTGSARKNLTLDFFKYSLHFSVNGYHTEKLHIHSVSESPALVSRNFRNFRISARLCGKR